MELLIRPGRSEVLRRPSG